MLIDYLFTTKLIIIIKVLIKNNEYNNSIRKKLLYIQKI